MLFNANSGAEAVSLSDALDPLIHEAADAVKQWPREFLKSGGAGFPAQERGIDIGGGGPESPGAGDATGLCGAP